ncbi:MAG: hypothetical protein GY772_02610 [bacterium]|nr:hypothetical protein [bacterium]MCP4436650.1 hypothetical protein [Actinomycetes bacterium]
MRLVSSDNELQMVAAMQAARTAPGNQIAAGMASAGAAPIDFGKLIAAAAPMGGGGGGAAPQAVQRRAPMRATAPTLEEEDDEFNWEGAGIGALSQGAKFAAMGAPLGVPGIVGLGAVGTVLGALQGGNS